jgi:hypothetical protein
VTTERHAERSSDSATPLKREDPEKRFTSWVCWFGNRTRQWWAIPRSPFPYLVTAGSPEELTRRIAVIEQDGA